VTPASRAQNPPLAPPPPPPPPGGNPAPQKSDQGYRIKSNVDLVVLHTTVADE